MIGLRLRRRQDGLCADHGVYDATTYGACPRDGAGRIPHQQAITDTDRAAWLEQEARALEAVSDAGAADTRHVQALHDEDLTTARLYRAAADEDTDDDTDCAGS